MKEKNVVFFFTHKITFTDKKVTIHDENIELFKYLLYKDYFTKIREK